ncbi:MAG: hypothetical protein LBE13_05080 [Bacteroidales bacterium]|nr:hypothetical protein [Bacteroidales bacterium]
MNNKKIIFIGDNHMWSNEEYLLANNLNKLYEAGVRYFFVEGDLPETAIPGNQNYHFYMFYPWVGANWKYQNSILTIKINEINSTVPEKDALKIITPETGREEIKTWNILESKDFDNYRDAYAAEKIIEVLNASAVNDKAVVFYGSNHAIKKMIKNYNLVGKYKYDRKPLAFLLSSHYGELFASYTFFMADKYFGNIAVSENLWAKIVNKPAIISTDNNGNLFYNMDYFDGFIIEQEANYGLYYQYVPTGENLRFIFDLVYGYEKSLFNKNYVDKNYNMTDPQGQYLMGIYYLKLYYGNHFDYSFWKNDNTGPTLLEALDKLKDYAFKDDIDPSQYIQLDYSYKDMIQYSKHMIYADILNFLTVKDSDTLIENCTYAFSLLPEDLWSLYWIAFYQTEKKNYQEALVAFNTLFKTKIAYCMEILPLAYRKAAQCAYKIGDIELFNYYNKLSIELYNEHYIDVSGYYYTGNLYEQ